MQAIDQEYQPVDVQVRNNGNGTYTCRYTPRNPVRHCILIDYGGVAIPNSPFRVSSLRWIEDDLDDDLVGLAYGAIESIESSRLRSRCRTWSENEQSHTLHR